MKKLVFFILIIPLLLSSWTGTWDKGYVVEEKVDSIPTAYMMNYPLGRSWYNAFFNDYIDFRVWGYATGQGVTVLPFHFLFNGNEKVFVESLQVVYKIDNYDLTDADTILVRVDTLKKSYTRYYYSYLVEEITAVPKGIYISTFTMQKEILFKEKGNYAVTLYWKVNAGSNNDIEILYVVFYYKAYYKVR